MSSRVGAYASPSLGSMPCSRKMVRSLSSSVFNPTNSLASGVRPAAASVQSFSRAARAASSCFSLSRSPAAASKSCLSTAASFSLRTCPISWSRSSRSGRIPAQRHQHLSGHAVALTDEAEQDVLGTDVSVAQSAGFPLRQLQHLFRSRGERDVPRRRLLTLADDRLHLLPYRVQADPQRLQRPGRHALALMDQTQQEVLSADVIVVQHPGCFLRQDNNPPCPVGKPLEHAPCRPSPSHTG